MRTGKEMEWMVRGCLLRFVSDQRANQTQQEIICESWIRLKLSVDGERKNER